MAVFTPLSDRDIRAFLARYALGELESAAGIAEGVENTNYLITAGGKKYILTLFEGRTDVRELPFFMQLTRWLHARGIPCPRPIAGKDGAVIYTLKDKPAAVVEFLDGRNNPEITPEHLSQVGDLIARLHLMAEGFPMARRNALSISGWQEWFARFRHRADEIYSGCETEIARELDYLDRHWPHGLPRGIIHADMFPDNVFFKEGTLSGVIDFYFACNDFWLHDVFICMNAWCFDAHHHFVPERARALFAAYNARRPLTDAERAAFPIIARGAAMRFIVTRCYDWLNRPAGALVTPKDPMEYIAKLRFHQQRRDLHEYGL